MIGKQINFFLMPEDQRQLIDRLDTKVGCALIKRNGEHAYHRAQDNVRASDDWATSYLCPPSRSDELVQLLAAQPLGCAQLEAIEFLQCTLLGNMLRRGRFWYAKTYFQAGRIIDKSSTFSDWADRIFVESKKELSYMSSIKYWIGSDAKTALESGSIELRRN